ncbi:SDR family NAD(P)-dependent oxidoreductase [Sorangium sp. So ce269]
MNQWINQGRGAQIESRNLNGLAVGSRSGAALAPHRCAGAAPLEPRNLGRVAAGRATRFGSPRFGSPQPGYDPPVSPTWLRSPGYDPPWLRSPRPPRVALYVQVSSEGGQIAYPNFILYHATKWGIEGFIEAVALEVAPSHVEFTIAEAGPVRTDFSRGLVSPPPMAVHDDTPAGEILRAVAAGTFEAKRDPEKMAQAMIDSADRSPAPRRLALGSGTYASIGAALTDRLAALVAQKHIALSTDAND